MGTQIKVVSRIESLSEESGSGGGLADSLSRIVNSPAQLDLLQEVIGPFCHQSRNILNSLKMSLYLAQREEGGRGIKALKDVEGSCLELEELYDRLQLIYRPVSLTCVRMSLGLLIDDRRQPWVDRFADRGRILELVAPRRPDVGDYDPNVLGRALDAFVFWRADMGKSGQGARLSWSIKRGAFELDWLESESASGKAVGDAGEPVSCKGAFALPVLARVVTAHGGMIRHLKPGGEHLRLSWPQSVECPR